MANKKIDNLQFKAQLASNLNEIKKLRSSINAISKKTNTEIKIKENAEEQEFVNSLPGLYTPPQNLSTRQINNLDTLIMNNRYYSASQQRMLLSNLYAEHGIIQTVIEQPVLDAFRGGLDIESPELNSADIQEFQEYIEEKGILNTYQEAEIWKGVFGGAGMVINVEVDPANPFNMRIPEKGELDFYAADRWELSGDHSWGSDFYLFYSTKLHKSRVIELLGKRPPSYLRPQTMGWGMSKVDRLVTGLNSYFKNNALIFELLDEAKVDVYSIENFNTSLINKGGAKIKARIMKANQLKNYYNAIVLDMKEKYEQKQLSFSGLSEMATQIRIGIACEARMPVTKLFGVSSAGFNSGEDDIENYNALVESEIRTPARTKLRKILKLCFQNYFGFIPTFHFDFKSLRMMSQKEEEEVKTSRQNRILQLYDKGLLVSKDVGQCVNAYKLLPVQTDLEKGLLDDQPEPPSMQQINSNENLDFKNK